MTQRKITSLSIADHIRRVLRDGGSAPHSEEVQRFFKEQIHSRGWRTAELRKVAVRFRRSIAREKGMDFLIEVADELFSGRVLEEKVFGVFLLEGQTSGLGEREFKLFSSWLNRISSWADHDALVHDVLAPMISEKPARSRQVFVWAKSQDRWRRRAACVALIRGTRKKQFFPEIMRLTEFLLEDKDDMVQKGLGWLLRETTKYDAKKTVPYLMKIRKRSPRLVLRTACETLPAAIRNRVLA